MSSRFSRLNALPGLRPVWNDAALMWAGQMAGIVVSVLAGILLARELGPELRGIYGWLLTLAGLGTAMASCGLDLANRRYVGEHPKETGSLMRLNLLVVSVAGVLLGLGLGAYARLEPASGGNLTDILLAMASLAPATLNLVLIQILVAQQRIRTVALGLFYPKLLLALGMAALVAMGWASVTSALVVNLASWGAALAYVIWALRAELRQPGTVSLPTLARAIFWGTGSLFVVVLAQYAMLKLDVLMIGVLLGPREVGFYAVASSMADVMVTPAHAIAGILAARLAARHSHVPLRLSLFGMLALTAVGAGAVYLISPWLVPLLYGNAFVPSVPVLQALTPAVVALAAYILLQACLGVVGRVRHLPWPPLVGLALNVALNLLLIPTYGLIGACIASAVAYAVAALLAGGLLLMSLKQREKTGRGERIDPPGKAASGSSSRSRLETSNIGRGERI